MIRLYGKIGDIKALLEQAIAAGYGHLPALEAIKLFLERN